MATTLPETDESVAPVGSQCPAKSSGYSEDYSLKTLEMLKVVRSAIEHENGLQNTRVGHLMTLQGFFFATLAFAWDKPDAANLIYAIGTLAILMNVLSIESLALSKVYQGKIFSWWYGTDDKTKTIAYSVRMMPPIVETPASQNNFLSHFRLWRLGVPTLLMLSWMIVLVVHSLRLVGK